MELQKVSQVYRRRYLLRQVGLEFILEDGDSLMLCFLNEAIRDQVRYGTMDSFTSQVDKKLHKVTYVGWHYIYIL